LVGKIQGVEVDEISVAVAVGEAVHVGGIVGGVAVCAGIEAAGRRTVLRIPQRLTKITRLRHPMSVVTARLEFQNLLMAFIPFRPLQRCSCADAR
jgi:hypothetical protein